MARLAIDVDFMRDYAALEKAVRNKVDEVFAKFETATHTGLHLEQVKDARDKRLRTIRIDQFWRGVVLAPDSGDVYTLLKVLPHDDAYQWAQRRTVSVNAATGALEIRDVVTIDAAVPAWEAMAKAAPARLFEGVKDAELKRLGVDDEIIGFARTLTAEAQLDMARGFLPAVQWDVLAGLASGMAAQEVWAELASSIVVVRDGDGVDVEDVAAAIERTPDRLALVDGPEELLALLARPFDLWRVYLHPSQRQAATARFRGPARVTGGPGTGKTVVALHRSVNLARAGSGDERILLTTFSASLTESLRGGLRLLTDDDAVLGRIEVATLDAVARRVVAESLGSAPALISAEAQTALWHELITRHEADFAPAFLAEEWRQVLLAQGLSSREEYQAATRVGRGRRLGARRRDVAWGVMAAFEAELTARRCWTFETLTREANRLLVSGSVTVPYRHVVIDEGQDFSPWQWRFVRALVGVGADDIFIAGDAHQRIYGHRVSLRELGVAIAGRSSRLTVNYRTTAEIVGWSLGTLRGERIDDLDAGLDSIAGYRSPLHGRPPRLTGYPRRAEELAGLVSTVAAWRDAGIAPDQIGVTARSNSAVEQAVGALGSAGIPAFVLGRAGAGDDGGVTVGTMHRMKGLEFRCVAVVGLNDHAMPVGLTPEADDPVAHAHDVQRERCLLFVACTRAREELAVSWYGSPSRLLGGGEPHVRGANHWGGS